MSLRAAFALIFITCALDIRAAAQDRLVLSAYGALGAVNLAASQTFDAVSGNHCASSFGGGAQISWWRRLFVDVGFSSISKSGERVALTDGEVIPLGVPLTVEMQHFDIAAGWRQSFGRLSPYVGAGITRLRYIESDSSEPVDLVMSKVGPMLIAGVDVSITRWVRAGVELRGRSVRGILGATGASAHYGEQSAGGIGTALRLSVGR